jgi:hypothetical protein
MKKFKSTVRSSDPHTTREPRPRKKTGPSLPGARRSPGTDLPLGGRRRYSRPLARRPSQIPGREPDPADESSCLGPGRTARARLQFGQAVRPMETFLRRRRQERRALGSIPWTVANRRTRPGSTVDCGGKHRADVLCIAGRGAGEGSARVTLVRGEEAKSLFLDVTLTKSKTSSREASLPTARPSVANSPHCPAQPAPRRARKKVLRTPPQTFPDRSARLCRLVHRKVEAMHLTISILFDLWSIEAVR